MITRQDITPGYQVVQTAHAVADFAAARPEEFAAWKAASNSIICLAVPDEDALKRQREKVGRLLPEGSEAIVFTEPDIGDEWTAFAFYAQWPVRKKLKHLPLAGVHKQRLQDPVPAVM